MRTLLAIVAASALVACGARSATIAPDADPGGGDRFCAGAPKAQLNGEDLLLDRVVAEPSMLNCCDGAVLRFFERAPGGSWRLLIVMLRIEGVASVVTPAAVDIGRLPAGWSLRVELAHCTGDSDCVIFDGIGGWMVEDSEMSGTLAIDGDWEEGRTVSICLDARRVLGDESAELQHVRLFAADVTMEY